jgi:ketosteroid isomerase-like protein
MTDRATSKTNRGRNAVSKRAISQLDLRGPMWSIHHTVARTSRELGTTLQERLERVEEELAIKDLLTRYTYFYDGADIDGVMSVFHDDCVLINPRGTYVGKDAIRRNYAFLISLSKIVLHFATNAMVRFAKDGEEAWMTAYYYGVAATPDGKLIATGGTYADHLVKVKGDWKIIERRITYNLRHTLSPAPPGRMPGAPIPTKKESSRDIVGNGTEM